MSNSQLAAIMFTDIVGYTALMGKDSEKALQLVRQNREIQKPIVEKNGGIWIKEMGDGVLAQFNSALDAVNCAVEIQRASRADFEADIRIGIHLGDITVENRDVFGDGVNVASRLESVAEPGGIYISESIEKAIRGRTKVHAKYLGEISLKNVDYKVRTYALQGVGLPVPKVQSKNEITGRFWAEINRRGVLQAGITYILIGVLLTVLYVKVRGLIGLPEWPLLNVGLVLILGLPIALFLAWNFEKSPSGFIRTSSEKSWNNPFELERRKPLTGKYVIIGLLVVILAIYFYPINPGTEQEVDQLTSGSFPSKSIAVLPFKNLSGSQENLYFSDGVMEAVLNNLSRIQDLKVISRTSVEQYRDQNKSIREIAQELEVAHILEGSVQRVGDDVRITAQLISAEEDEHIWANNYDRHLTDIFEIQSEIAQTIAENLEVIMTIEEKELIKNAPTSNLKAYELYLKAFHTNVVSESEIFDAIALCDSAIKMDPDFGWPYTLKGEMINFLSVYGYPEDLWNDSAQVLLDMAIARDPKDFWAFAQKAMIYNMKQNPDKVVQYLHDALDLNPNFAYAYYFLGEKMIKNREYEKGINYLLKGASLSNVGGEFFNERTGYLLFELDIEPACQHFLQFHEDNPEHGAVLQQLINCSRYFGDFDKVMEYAQKLYNLSPDMVNVKNYVAEAHFFKNEYQEAESIYQEMIRETEDFESDYMIFPFVHRLGFAMMRNGKESEGKALMENYRDVLLSIIDQKQVKAAAMGEYYDLACIYSSLGKIDEAFKWLNTAKEKEVTDGAFFETDYLLTDPMLDNLRGDSRFKSILEEKFQEQEKIKSIYYQKLSEYHSNNELNWLNSQL